MSHNHRKRTHGGKIRCLKGNLQLVCTDKGRSPRLAAEGDCVAGKKPISVDRYLLRRGSRSDGIGRERGDGGRRIRTVDGKQYSSKSLVFRVRTLSNDRDRAGVGIVFAEKGAVVLSWSHRRSHVRSGSVSILGSVSSWGNYSKRIVRRAVNN